MKIDEKIKQRFRELDDKTKELSLQDKPRFFAWATSVSSLTKIVFGEHSPQYEYFESECRKIRDNPAYYSYGFQACLGIFRGAKEDFEAGYLFTVRGLIKAEDSMDVLEQATSLLNGNYKDAACILAGVALEIAIKEMCNRNSIQIAKLETMNIELGKKIYNMGMQKQITAWAHWRNKAAHGEFSEYDHAQVKGMIEGVQKFVADYL
jgi:HEPN domain-containing protein